MAEATVEYKTDTYTDSLEVLQWLADPQNIQGALDLLRAIARLENADLSKLDLNLLVQQILLIYNSMSKYNSMINQPGGFPGRGCFRHEDLDTRTTRSTRIVEIGDVRDDWTDLSLIVTWNLWGLAPVNAVQDFFKNAPQEQSILQKLEDFLRMAVADDLLGIFQVKPFEQRQFEDSWLKEKFSDIEDPPASTFFAITGHQEAWIFADALLFLTATNDGLQNHQDRLRGAAYLDEGVARAYKIEKSKLFGGWKWYIGTDNAFREPESTDFPFANMTHKFSGKFAATGPGLFLMSTHEPHAIGYQEFKFKPERSDDGIALKGLLWGFWKNDAGKGVIAVVTHFLTGDNDKPRCVQELEEFLLDRAYFFARQVEELEVYALGDLNWEFNQVLACARDYPKVLKAMRRLTGDSYTTRDLGGSHRLDHIFGGKFNMNPDKKFDEHGELLLFEGLEGMESFVVPEGNENWEPMSYDEPKYRKGLSDHKMVVVKRSSAPSV